MNNTLVNPKWFENPIVTESARAVSDRGELSALLLLQEVSRRLNDLEERFPGIPFTEILKARQQPDRETARRGMELAGIAEEDIDIVLGPRLELVDQRLTLSEANFDLVAAGLSHGQLVECGLSKTMAHDLTSLRCDYTAKEKEILLAFDAEVVSTVSGAARELGTSRPTVHRALAKRAYRRWLNEGESPA